MTSVQLNVLMLEFQKDPNWEGDQFTSLAQRLGVPRIKVYKWWWDVRKRHEKATNKVGDQGNHAREGEVPSPLITIKSGSNKVENSYVSSGSSANISADVHQIEH